MWGYTEEQIAQFGLTFGVGAFMLAGAELDEVTP